MASGVVKKRLDLLLVERGLFPTRQRAQAAIMAGQVRVEGKKIEKPGERVPVTAEIEVSGPPLPYVSRGGLKLEEALRAFSLNVENKVALDVGASTGGFTDCLLKHGARKVYAVDVGYGQLAWSLRQDLRVVVMEKTNARDLSLEMLGERVDLATIDVSFISLLKVLPAVLSCLKPGGDIIALVKPQFEAGRRQVGKGGVVKDPQVHKEVLLRIIEQGAALGLNLHGLIPSPIRGPKGNIEFLLWWSCRGGGIEPPLWSQVVEKAVARGWQGKYKGN